MYEVLRFVEHGTECRQSIDCLQGELLIYYLRDHTQIEKTVLFEWIRQIAEEVMRYQQSRRGQNYRYLTPYSVVVTEEGELLLLNPDAQENEFAMKKMQQKAVRKHFLRPSLENGGGRSYPADLYGYGKMLQFLLAYTEQIPELTRGEERKLERIIERCTGTGRRPYDRISQVLGDLPEERRDWDDQQKEKLRKVKLAVLLFTSGAVITAAGIGLSRGKTEEPVEVQAENAQMEEAKVEEKEAQTVSLNQPKAVEAQIRSLMENLEYADRSTEFTNDIAKDLTACLEVWNEQKDAKKDDNLLYLGEKLEKEILRILADVYEREEQTEEAIQTCSRLLEMENRKEEIQKTGQQKMRLEAKLGQYQEAIATGKAILEKTGESQEITELIVEYDKKAKEKTAEETTPEQENQEEADNALTQQEPLPETIEPLTTE